MIVIGGGGGETSKNTLLGEMEENLNYIFF